MFDTFISGRSVTFLSKFTFDNMKHGYVTLCTVGVCAGY